MNSNVKLAQQENESGDQSQASQGFGRVSSDPARLFHPVDEREEACKHFIDQGYVVLKECLNPAEVKFFNDFFDETQIERSDSWGLGEKRKPHHRNQGLIFSQPLLDYPELDPFTQHPASYPLVAEILGGEEHVRFSEFNLRETPAGAGHGTMNFHHDATSEDRLIRKPYMPCDWLCAIHYLTDVDVDTPAFCVVPGSNSFGTLKEAYKGLGDDYREVPIRGPAGTCVLYDSATFHTRLDGDGEKMRRTWHQYYARGGWIRSSLPTTNRYLRSPSPVLTDWNLFPERLAMHADKNKRLFFSHWNTAMGEWVASGFDPEVRKSMPRGEQ